MEHADCRPGPAEQREALEGATDRPMARGQTWYLVAAKWWGMLQTHLGGGGPAPGPVDNAALTSDEGSAAGLELREGLVENRDWVAVTDEAWALLSSWYGGGPAVSRSVIEAGLMRKARLDLHPQILCVRWAVEGEHDDGDDGGAGEGAGDAAEPRGEAVAVSRNATLADLAARLARGRGGREAAGAPGEEEDAGDENDEDEADPSVRLWLREDGVWTVVSGDDLTVPVENFQLSSGAAVLAERRRADGTWPRSVAARDWRDFRVGDVIECLDTERKWYESTIRDVKEDRIFVHFNGWEATWDEWVDRGSARLAERGTHTSGAYKHSSHSRWGRIGNSTGRPPVRGAAGLSNLGNTCFMNCTLQCLSNTAGLTDYFLRDDYRRDLNRANPLGWQGRVAEEYAELLKELWSGHYTAVSPARFKQAIGEFQPRFSGYQQQDSSELLSFLLDGLHEDLNRVREKPATQAVESDGRPDAEVAAEAWDTHLLRNRSVVVDTMQGQLKSRLVCPDCGRVSVTFDPFMFLSVPLPVETEMTFEAAFVPHAEAGAEAAAPSMFALTVPKDSSIASVKAELARLAAERLERPVRAADLLAADVYSSRVYRVVEDDTPASDMNSGDHVYFYELPGLSPPGDDGGAKQDAAEGAGEMGGGGTGFSPLDDDFYGPMRGASIKRVDEAGYPGGLRPIQVVHQRLARSQYYSNRPTVENFGTPLVLMLEATATVGDARAALARLVAPFEADGGGGGGAAGAAGEGSDTDSDAGDDAAVPADEDETTDEEAGAGGEDDASDSGSDPAYGGGGGVATTSSYDLYLMDAYARGGPGRLLDNADDLPMWDDPEAQGRAVEDPGAGAMSDSDDSFGGINSYEAYGGHYGRASSAPRQAWQPISVGVRWHSPDSYDADRCDWERMPRDETAVAAAEAATGGAGESAVELGDCLRLFTEEETLSAEDPWYCRVCKKHQRATKKFDLWRLPDVLVLHLKRFSFTRLWREKITSLVNFPFEGLSLDEFCANEEYRGAKYDLFAVSNHYGGMGGGHYTAHARNPLDGEWYDFDDSRISAAKPEDARTPAAYVLFYQRRKDDAEQQ